MRYILPIVMLLAAAPAMAAETTEVRMGAHPGFGRVVFEFPAPTPFKVEREGDTVVLRFTGAGDIPATGSGTRNIVGVVGGVGMATVTVASGATLRTMHLGNRVVVDVLDPNTAKPAARPAAAAKAPPPATAVAAPPATSVAAPLATSVAAPPPTPVATPAHPPMEPSRQAAERPKQAAPQPASLAAPPPTAAPHVLTPPASLPAVITPAAIAEPAPVVPVIRDAGPAAPPPAPATPAPIPAGPNAAAEPVALAATHMPLPDGETGSSVLLPFGTNVAAAAFRHGDQAWLVFDERRPLDLAALGDDPMLAGAAVQLLPQATLIRLKAPASGDLRMERKKEGWSLTLAAKPGTAPPLVPMPRPARLLFPATGLGQVVVVPDPDTGENLLVGTMQLAAGVPVAYRVPEFSVLPSWQGVVVEPLSDRTQLRPVPEGFAIETGAPLAPPPDSARALEDAAVLTRRFDFPAEPAAILLRRLQMQVADQGRAAAQARLEPRKRAAQTMLSLGLGPEAQALLGLATAEDPRAAGDPEIAGLIGIASLMSNRPAEADGLLNPALTGTDEIALWRAVRATMLRPGSPEAAPVFAGTIGLVLSYPAALRNRLLPIAAETMAAGGAPEAADALLAKMPDEPLLALTRAMRLEAQGKTADALTLYDALALGRDRLASARAATRATLLRLASGAMTPGSAADALERQFFNWRGDDREEKLRLRVAALRAQAGQWRPAFALLRETVQLFPDAAPQINARMTSLMTELLRGPGAASIPPMELVSLAEENAEMVGQADQTASASLLADKLAALDLPKRAGPIIERMMTAAPAGEGRATLGARLARMRLGDGDDAGAGAALSGSDAPDLPAALLEQRGLIDARLHARAHDPGGAAAILSGIDTNGADDLRATILGDAGDWHGAVAALGSLVSRSIPPSGALSPAQQDILLRLASAQARAGDDAALRLLGMKEADRMGGPRADMFRLLTAAPVSNVGDLKRSAGEVALARAVPAGLAAIGSR